MVERSWVVKVGGRRGGRFVVERKGFENVFEGGGCCSETSSREN